MIAASDFPLLVGRLDEMRDAMATVPELRDYLRGVADDPPPDLAREALRLLAEPRFDLAIEGLIAGSRESWWARRPLLRAVVVAELRRIIGLPKRRTAWAAAS